MQELHFLSTTTNTKPFSSNPKSLIFPSSSYSHHDSVHSSQQSPSSKTPHFPILSSTKTKTKTKTSQSKFHHQNQEKILNGKFLKPQTEITRPIPTAEFQEKALYLDSLGLDLFSLIADHPPIVSHPLPDLKSTVQFLSTMKFTTPEFRRLVGMCPEILTSRVADLVLVFTFLLREARVNVSDLKRVLNRRPRLLVSSVSHRLRPTLCFLHSIGIADVRKHTSLLSCSVEEKLLPRLDYLLKVGFARRDALAMFRRFPQLFCLSISNNLEPKFNYFVVQMGRDLKELIEFPFYFSFSLENRIRPRHQRCVDKGVCFPLPVLLKTSEFKFHQRLEVCCNSSIPLRNSPLWCTDMTSSDLLLDN